MQSFGERPDTLITERPGDRQPQFAPGRKGVNLPFVLNLQTMLDRTKKNVGIPQNVNMFARQDLQLLKGVQCFEGITLLQERVFRSVQQLQGLQGKLDFAYAAVPEF